MQDDAILSQHYECCGEKKGLSEAQLDGLLQWLESELLLVSPFVLWLAGEMGAGKTTLVRSLMRRWGLPETTPVISPTYTIVNEYQIADDVYAHLDLYRAETNFSIPELGLREIDAYRGLFVEWPEQTGQSEEFLKASHILKIKSPDFSVRDYSLYRRKA